MWPVFPIKAAAVGIKIYVKETATRTVCTAVLGQIEAAEMEPSHPPVSAPVGTGAEHQGWAPLPYRPLLQTVPGVLPHRPDRPVGPASSERGVVREAPSPEGSVCLPGLVSRSTLQDARIPPKKPWTLRACL